MSPVAQTVIVVLLVAGAALYVARKVWLSVARARRERNAAGCGADGCCK
ncbi:MAG: FeoB-associated Cys-rich membrane protein [Gemmatimonadaceae bacterium]|nr:FeoB-associated Cys-rich membrane protein [Gemmatimonadaceae bacterium]